MEEQFKEHLSESVNPEDPVPEIFALDSSLNRFYKMTVNPQKDTVYAACGLSPMEASALVVLHDIQPVTMSKLAHYCGFSPSKTTRAVNVLVKKGLAKREILRKKIHIQTVNYTMFKQGLPRIRNSVKYAAGPPDILRSLQKLQITNHKWTAVLINFLAAQSLNNDFRTDASPIPHCERYDRPDLIHTITSISTNFRNASALAVFQHLSRFTESPRSSKGSGLCDCEIRE